jgi:formyltetrahydrofolate-dependent phosphoribosylglycinamide formyltransferase
MRALVEAVRQGTIPGAEVSVVVAPSATSPALASAQELGVTVAVAKSDDELVEAFAECDVVCLAGYMRLVPAALIAAHPDRILNIHPALLPKFGGKGMYGHHVHEAVLAAGETESGCTVHFVNEQYDEGQILLQHRCPVLPDDTAESLAARVLQLEHRAYPEAVTKVLLAG